MHVDYSVDKDELYTAWRDWCEAAGETEAAKRSKKWLTHQMTRPGIPAGRCSETHPVRHQGEGVECDFMR